MASSGMGWGAVAAGVGVGIAVGVAVSTMLTPAPTTGGAAAVGADTSLDTNITGTAAAKGAEQELMSEQLSRNVLFFGEKGQRRIEDAFVIVVGLGGVGSHAAHMLARAGVGKMRYAHNHPPPSFHLSLSFYMCRRLA